MKCNGGSGFILAVSPTMVSYGHIFVFQWHFFIKSYTRSTIFLYVAKKVGHCGYEDDQWFDTSSEHHLLTWMHAYLFSEYFSNHHVSCPHTLMNHSCSCHTLTAHQKLDFNHIALLFSNLLHSMNKIFALHYTYGNTLVTTR
jgi:hypothetical protein